MNGEHNLGFSHKQLCDRAAAWLRGRRCEPVLTKIGSAGEIPDAIGWSSRYGSTVVECKTLRADFLGDRNKYVQFRHIEHGWIQSGKRYRKELQKENYAEESLPSMGERRYFLCPPNVATVRDVEERYPDHGLLHVVGKRIFVAREAPRREKVAYQSEIRYLRFALIHLKENLLKHGCSVDLVEATKFFGTDGITLPAPKTRAAVSLD